MMDAQGTNQQSIVDIAMGHDLRIPKGGFELETGKDTNLLTLRHDLCRLMLFLE